MSASKKTHRDPLLGSLTFEAAAVGAEAHFFDVLGIQPVVGGFFNAEVDGNQFVLTNGFWRQEYGSDPTVVGRTARLNGRTGEIVEITDNGFVVVAGRGGILVKRVRPEGGGKAAAVEFIAAEGIEKGARLGS